MKPRLLDLYCGAGGAGMGYHRAGFKVIGVDIKPQPRYPFEFVQDDVLNFMSTMVEDDMWEAWGFNAIHASPPCQAHSALKTMPDALEHYDYIPETRAALIGSGLPYVIENVPGAPLIEPMILCGSHFKLQTASGVRLRRHRLFETSMRMRRRLWSCNHRRGERCIGVYGGGHGVSLHRYQRGERSHTAAEQREVMGIDWMTVDELSQAIPPAYTEYIGRRLMEHLERASA